MVYVDEQGRVYEKPDNRTTVVETITSSQALHATESVHSGGTMTLHPRFSDLKGDMYLISIDSIYFRVRFADLQRYSAYFAKFEHDPLPGGDLPWFSVELESSSLALILCTFQSSLKALCPTPEAALIDLPGALYGAKEYKFEGFYSALLKAFARADPFVRFAVAALAGDEARAKELSTSTLRTTSASFSKDTKMVLNEHAPGYYARLIRLHQSWESAYKDLHLSLATDLQVNIKLDGFGSQCKKRFGRGCDAFIMTQGKFSALREIVASATVAALKETGAVFLTPAIEDAIYNAARCQTCANRHINAFGAALARASLGRLPKSI